MTTVRRLAPAAATSVLVAIALDLIYGPWFLNYDARYALLWAQDLANGHAPDVADKHYLNSIRRIPADARTLEAAMDIESELELILDRPEVLEVLAYRLGGDEPPEPLPRRDQTLVADQLEGPADGDPAGPEPRRQLGLAGQQRPRRARRRQLPQLVGDLLVADSPRPLSHWPSRR